MNAFSFQHLYNLQTPGDILLKVMTLITYIPTQSAKKKDILDSNVSLMRVTGDINKNLESLGTLIILLSFVLHHVLRLRAVLLLGSD